MADMVDYPSGAPLPKFNITRAQGQTWVVGEVASVQFEVSISNFQEMMDWFRDNNYGVDYVSDVRLYFSSPHTDESQNFEWGVGIIEPNSIALRNFGQWNPLVFDWIGVKRIVDGFLHVFPYRFSSPLPFCEVYVPIDLPSVLTDLEFRTQSPPPPPPPPNGVDLTPLLIISGLGIAGAVAYYLWRKKRK